MINIACYQQISVLIFFPWSEVSESCKKHLSEKSLFLRKKLFLFTDTSVSISIEESWIPKCQHKMTTFASVTSIRSVDSYFIHLLAESPSLHVQPPSQRGLKWYFEKQFKRHAVQWELNSLSILLQGPKYITGRQHILAKTLVF